MNKKVIGCILICLTLASLSYTGGDIAHKMFKYTSAEPVQRSVTPSIKIEESYGPCGICNQSDLPVTEYWPHPLGNGVHSNCLKSISRIEESTGHKLEYLLKTHHARSHYATIHSNIVTFINKLCYPQNIADYIQQDKHKDLKRFFSSATDLAMLFYLNPITTTESSTNIASEHCQPATIAPRVLEIEWSRSTLFAPSMLADPETAKTVLCLQRTIIAFVTKLCYPETIEDYLKKDNFCIASSLNSYL